MTLCNCQNCEDDRVKREISHIWGADPHQCEEWCALITYILTYLCPENGAMFVLSRIRENPQSFLPPEMWEQLERLKGLDK